MVRSIIPDDFSKEVVKAMKQYTTEVEEGISYEVVANGFEAIKELSNIIDPIATKQGSAKPSINRQWTNYSKSWVGTVDKKANYTKITVHNKKHYQLTHLLEYGHITRDGKTRTREYAHIKPVGDFYSKKLLDNVKKVIEKGGKL